MVKNGTRLLGTLAAGDGVGEMGYLTHAKRTASIYAVNDVLALKVNEALIEQASVGCQLKFLKVFLRTLVSRLTRTSEALAGN
jgi:CRP-like cAMP-binding protein